MPTPIAFALGALQWLDAHPGQAEAVYAWAFRLAAGEAPGGLVLPGFIPTVRRSRIPVDDETTVTVTYASYPNTVVLL